jgi:hypothetical protein
MCSTLRKAVGGVHDPVGLPVYKLACAKMVAHGLKCIRMVLLEVKKGVNLARAKIGIQVPVQAAVFEV